MNFFKIILKNILNKININKKTRTKTDKQKKLKEDEIEK
jgi:hypothetical protein